MASKPDHRVPLTYLSQEDLLQAALVYLQRRELLVDLDRELDLAQSHLVADQARGLLDDLLERGLLEPRVVSFPSRDLTRLLTHLLKTPDQQAGRTNEKPGEPSN